MKKFAESDLTLGEYLDALVAELKPGVEATVAATEARIAEYEQRIAELEFEQLVAQNARLGGVLPSACDLIVSDVRKLFELRDGALKVRNGETHPGDPLMPLTFDVWLEEQRKVLPFLFVKTKTEPTT